MISKTGYEAYISFYQGFFIFQESPEIFPTKKITGQVLAGNNVVNGSMLQYGGGGFGQKAGDGQKGRLGRVLVRSDVEVQSSSDFTCPEGKSFVDGSTNKNQPKNGISLRTRTIGKRQLKMTHTTVGH